MSDKKNGKPDREKVNSDTREKEAETSIVEAPEEEKPAEPSEEELKEVPKEIQRFIGMSLQSVFRGPLPHPIYQKINESHIDKILDSLAKSEENEYRKSCLDRWFTLFYSVLGVGFLVFLIIFLSVTGRGDYLDKVIMLLAAILGAFGGGFGYNAYRESKRKR